MPDLTDVAGYTGGLDAVTVDDICGWGPCSDYQLDDGYGGPDRDAIRAGLGGCDSVEVSDLHSLDIGVDDILWLCSHALTGERLVRLCHGFVRAYVISATARDRVAVTLYEWVQRDFDAAANLHAIDTFLRASVEANTMWAARSLIVGKFKYLIWSVKYAPEKAHTWAWVTLSACLDVVGPERSRQLVFKHTQPASGQVEVAL